MSYSIQNPEQRFKIGVICISKSKDDYRELIELDEWDTKSGATHRIANCEPPYRKIVNEGCITSNNTEIKTNIFHHTFLVKQISKNTFLLMNDNEEWSGEKLYFHSMEIFAQKYAIRMFV